MPVPRTVRPRLLFFPIAIIAALPTLNGEATQSPPARERVLSGEERWIASSVMATARRLAGSDPSAPDPAADLAAGSHIWAPEAYQAKLSRLLGTEPKASATVDHDARARLTDLSREALLAESVRLSALLGRDRRSAPLHESAALLVAAFGLKEPPGIFGDVRPALTRTTAHLAVAQALRGDGPETVDGALARVTLEALAGNQRAALMRLEGVGPRLTTAADRAWDRALRLRITGNWRAPLDADRAPLLERLEQGRALLSRVGDDALEAALDDLVHEHAADWPRLAHAGRVSVGLGRATTEDVVEQEGLEARRVWSALHPGSTVPADLSKELNAGIARDSQPGGAILDWGLWAGFSQRRLANAVRARHRLLADLALPEQEKAFAHDVRTTYQQLALYSALLGFVADTPEEHERAASLGRKTAASNPEILTAAAWNLFATRSEHSEGVEPVAPVPSWFGELVPAGTAFDLRNRALRSGQASRPADDQLRLWAEEARFDTWTQWSFQWRLAAGAPQAEPARAAFGPLLDYDLAALRFLAVDAKMSAADRLATYRRLCETSPFGCYDLADYLVREGKDPEAAPTYERWMNANPDAVAVANASGWLVRYYLRAGRLAEAERLAETAGDAHSHRGLRIYAHFLDRQGREAEAEQVCRTIQKRYDRPEQLGVFFVRKGLRRNDRALQQQGWDLMRDVFPQGGERLAWNTLSGAPTDGVRFGQFGRRLAAIGLKRSDIIVGVDEWRVRTAAQYDLLADLRHDETMTFTVWRDGRYEQIHATVRERWLGVQLRDY
jgi:Tetratricopeptide repeat